MTLAALSLVAGFVAGALFGVVTALRARDLRDDGYAEGCQDGADAMANEYLAERARFEDPIEAWPRQRGGERRPS